VSSPKASRVSRAHLVRPPECPPAARPKMTRCRPKLVLALGTVRLDRCRPGLWSGPTDPTMLPCRIRSIRRDSGTGGERARVLSSCQCNSSSRAAAATIVAAACCCCCCCSSSSHGAFSAVSAAVRRRGRAQSLTGPPHCARPPGPPPPSEPARRNTRNAHGPGGDLACRHGSRSALPALLPLQQLQQHTRLLEFRKGTRRALLLPLLLRGCSNSSTCCSATAALALAAAAAAALLVWLLLVLLRRYFCCRRCNTAALLPPLLLRALLLPLLLRRRCLCGGGATAAPAAPAVVLLWNQRDPSPCTIRSASPRAPWFHSRPTARTPRPASTGPLLRAQPRPPAAVRAGPACVREGRGWGRGAGPGTGGAVRWGGRCACRARAG
jgi:hypothetical protein